MIKLLSITLCAFIGFLLIPEHAIYKNISEKKGYSNKNNELPLSDNNAENKRAPYHKLSSIIYKADIPSGTIGITNEQLADNPFDNIFHIQIPVLPDQHQIAFLQYELYGVRDQISVARSINDAQAIGGHFVISDSVWNTQKEAIPLSALKKGDNIIRFGLHTDALYHYQVKAVSIIIENRTTQEASIVINRRDYNYYNNTGYVKGIIQLSEDNYNFSVGQTKLYCNNKPVPVYNNEFEIVIPKPSDSATSFTAVLKTVSSKGEVITKTIQFTTPETADFVDDQFAKGIAKEGLYSPENGLKLEMYNHFSVGINIPQHSLPASEKISVTALRDIDIAPLNTDLINVTKGAKAFRFLPHGTIFKNKASVTIPFDSTLIPEGYTASDIRTYFFNETTRQWVPLPLDTIINDLSLVISGTTHFTDMINGIIKVPESPQTQGYTPTSIKDIKAANPSLGIDFIDPPTANSMGTASFGLNFKLPKGRQGLEPNIGLHYNNEGGNGWTGLGWSIATPSISIDTRWGVPRYDAALETETYALNGEQMAPLTHKGTLIARTSEKQFHPRIEGSFNRIIRHGNSPQNYWWEVTNKNGTSSYYGGTPSTGVINGAVLKDDNGNIAHWAIVETRDLNDNFIHYLYETVLDPGISGGTVLGRQLYLNQIFYTGHNNLDGAYKVEFIRDRQLGEIKRKDIDISGRLGFKMVTADLLRKVTISYSGQLIRTYELQYKEGAFYKTLLKSIAELDDAGKVFYSHAFEYFDDVKSQTGYSPLGNPENWSPITDNIHGDIKSAIPGFSDEASALTSTKSENSSNSLSLTLGYLDGNNSKSNTVGGSFGTASGSTEGLVTMIDINGDGLPDKVFKQNGLLFYRANLGLTSHQFGNIRPIAGINNFSTGTSSTSSSGVEVNLLSAFWGRENSNTTNTTHIYFSDFNGDGLIDIASGGQVFFNRLNNNGDPVFLPSSTGTPSPILLGSGINPVFLAPDTALQSKQEKKYPLQDIIRMWEAPFNGNINVVAPLQLLNVSSPGIVNPKLDGVRASIQLSGNVLWSTIIPAGDFSVKTPVGITNLTIQKGQRIYFRLQSIYNGDEDVVKWDPIITYSNTITPSLDATNRHTNQYQASSDFILSNSQQNGLYKSGILKIDGSFIKGITNDTVILSVIKKSNGISTVVLQQVFPAKTVINQAILLSSLPVNNGDSLRFVLHTDSYIDRTLINWQPHYQYINFTDGTPITNLNGKPTIENYPVPDNSNYNDWLINTPLLVNIQKDTINIKPLISGNPSATGTVTFTVKTKDTILGKRKIQLLNGVMVGSIDSIRVERKLNDSLFCEYHITDRVLALALQNIKYIKSKDSTYLDINSNPVTVTVTQTLNAGLYTSPSIDYLGTFFRGWGHFSFKGDPTNGPLDESKINTNAMGNYSYDPNQYADTSLFNQIVDAAATEFVPLYSNTQRNAWVGFDTSVYVRGSFMGSSRLWMHDVSVDSLMAGASLTAAEKITNTNTTSYSMGLAVGVSANTTVSSSQTINTLDMMDMNGDRYPDVLHLNDIQFTSANGGLEQNIRTHNLGAANFNGNSNGYTLGGGGAFPASVAKETVSFEAKNVAGNAGSTIGISANASLSSNNDEISSSWLDINGDGLPDKIYSNGSVALNLGYKFATAENWGIGNIEKNHTDQFGAGTSFGFNIAYGSFQGGFGLLRSNDDCSTSLEDINGDGLPDELFYSSGTFTVRLNTGNSFGTPINWNGGGIIRKNSSTGESVNAAFTIVIPIPIPFFPLKFCINPSYSSGDGISRENAQITDIDGDGFPDIISSQNDGNLIAIRSNIARTNMLQNVKRPMGSSFTINYERLGNSYALPQSKWVLKSVEIVDGVKGDGIDTIRNSFSYEGGYYNRDEREFYGFSKVTTSELNTGVNNIVYRNNVQQFLNANYYTKGLIEKEWVQNAAGNKYSQTNNQYNVRIVQDSVQFPALVQTDKLFYEGNPVSGVSTSLQFNYDGLGNVIQINDYGDGSAQDKINAVITYHNNNTLYIKGVPATIEVTTIDGIKRKRATTLDNKGNISQIRQYLADGSMAIHDMEYDNFGNLSKIIRPANYKGQRMWYQYIYDNTVNTYVSKINDAFGYSSTSTYDYRFGELTGTISENNEPMRYQLDNRGRITAITGPYEIAAGKPYTLAFDYHPEAAVPYAISHHYDPEYNSDINTITFMDGLGRAIQVKKEVAIFKGKGIADDIQMVVSGKDFYDPFGRIIENRYPVTEPIGSGNTILNTNQGNLLSTINYDVLDRATSTKLADGATSNMTYSLTNGFFNTTTKDPLQNVKEVLSDVRGRNRIVNLLGGSNGIISTKFSYNALGELLSVTDAGGNTTNNTYDNLGRKLSIVHPDAGLSEFNYDLAGNLLKKTTAQIRKEIPNGGAIQYQYEFERVTDIDYPRQYQNKVKYTYGKSGTGNKAGRLILQEDASGGQEFFYGKLGEITKTIRTLVINNSFFTTYVSEQEYDTWNRIKTMTYPDGEVITYHYNKAGGLNNVAGYKLGNNYKYVNQLGYDEYEQRVYLQYGNGTENAYTYDPLRRRLANLKASTLSGRGIMNNSYSYDQVNNIRSIVNNVQAVSGKLGGYANQDFTYDNLYRLTNASGQYNNGANVATYNLTLSYDNLYNIKSKKMDGTQVSGSYDLAYLYGGAGAHQPTQIGKIKYSYDLNGNQLTAGTRQNFWDEENRLMAIIDNGILSRYTYDADGERTIKSSGGIQGIWVNGAPAGFINHDTNYTAYISPYLVCRRTGFTKHIYIESQRIATKIGNGNFANISFSMPALTAGGINYLKRLANIQKQRLDYYASLGISPGPPTDKYFYAHPYNSGIAAPIIIDSTASSIPPGWPGNTTSPTNGPPIFVSPIPSNDSVRAGYGFNGTGHFFEQNQYFYHPDHLGSSNYITDIFGEVSQHQEYSAFGETFVEEHRSSYESPYSFNAKEKDIETGLYYYGARYYDPRTSIWISVDPLAEKLPSFSPYVYCLNNPIKFIDPDGKFAVDWKAAGKGFVKGVVVGAVVTVGAGILIASGGTAAPLIGAGIAAYGAYQTGKSIYEVGSGKEAYTGRELSNSERSEIGGGLVGGIVGGVGAAKGIKGVLESKPNIASKGLALKNSLSDVLGNSYKAKGEVTAPIKNEGLLSKLNSTSKGDWVKVYEAGIKDGKKVETHYFRNNTTGEVFDVKTKYDSWHQKQFKDLKE